LKYNRLSFSAKLNCEDLNYQEQLLHENWKSKRKTILKQDKYICQKCQNINPLKSFEISRLGIRPIKNGILLISGKIEGGSYKELVCRSSISLFDSLKKYRIGPGIPFILFQAKEKSDFFNHIGTFFLDSKHYKFKKSSDKSKKLSDLFVDPKQIVEYERKLKLEIMDLLYTELTWLELRNLHIHHKYYQQGKLAWEYPNEALTTLCWHCHEELHKSTTVPFLDEAGNNIGEMTPCSRCFGAGIFPEYNHVQDGICFKCNGNRYDELIEK